MSAVKHTPGPWHWDDGDPLDNLMPRLVSESGEVVCDFGDCTQYYPTEGTPPDEFNARLIAAAPELLSALLLARAELPIAAASWNEDDNPEVVRAHVPRVLDLISAVDAVLRKATGGAA